MGHLSATKHYLHAWNHKIWGLSIGKITKKVLKGLSVRGGIRLSLVPNKKAGSDWPRPEAGRGPAPSEGRRMWSVKLEACG